jgi:NAD(P)-dependent dehydrogenase (short-subunit alcohol dehydrogenase family)
VALVTGGGSGIGFEVARQLGLHGAKVVIMGRRGPFLEKAVGLLQQEGIKATCKYTSYIDGIEASSKIFILTGPSHQFKQGFKETYVSPKTPKKLWTRQ